MKFTNSYITEFLSELNLVLTQEDYGNKLYDLITPVKSLLQKEDEILSFSLAKYSGANARLAFFCEWYYFTFKLTTNTEILSRETYSHLAKKLKDKWKNNSDFTNILYKNSQEVFLPMQIAFLHSKSQEFIDELILKHTFLKKYLNGSFLSQFTSGELQMYKRFISDELNLNQYIDLQAYRSSFLAICLPCLLGFVYNFNQQESVINPKGIKWNLVEDIFKQIAALHQTAQDKEFYRVVYEISLSEGEEKDWFEYDKQKQYQISSTNAATIDVVQMVREKIYQKLKNDLDYLVFPDKYKLMMQDLADWSFNLNNSTV